MGSERSSYKINWNALQGDDVQYEDGEVKPRFFMTPDQQVNPRTPASGYAPVREERNIEAYMRYRSMQPAAAEIAPRAVHPSFPARRSAHHVAAEIDAGGYRGASRPFPPAPQGLRRPVRKSLLKELSLAGAISIVFGGIAGLAVYDGTSGGGMTKSALTAVGLSPATVPSQPEKSAAALVEKNESSVIKKPVAIARLDVSDAEGDASSLIPLSLRAEGGDPTKVLTLRLTGLPERAYLTAGTRINATAWMLKPSEIENVKLVVPGNRADRFAIAVEAIEPQTGDLVAPVRELNVAVHAPAAKPVPAQSAPETAQVLPAAAPPDTERNFNLPKPASNIVGATAMPIPQPLEQTDAGGTSEIASLLESGDKLMDLGDLPAARPFYAKALEMGDKRAAWKLGQTYDPAVFAEKKVVGLPPDPKLALQYYLEAQQAGIAEADAAVSGIKALAAQ